MSSIARLYYMVRADVLERVRRPSFLIVLAVVVYAAYMFMPPNHSKIATLHVGTYRGIYNSAWVGSLVAVMAGVYLAMLGFYLIKNALDRDRKTRVGEILAATPLRRIDYVFVKMLSNATVLSLMVFVIVIAAAAMQMVRGESYVLSPLDLILPFVFFTFPVIAVISAVAVLFESVRFLRGGLGNVIYFFLWTTVIATIATALDSGRTHNDPVGMGILIPEIRRSAYEAFPEINPDSVGVAMGFHIRGDGSDWDLTTFKWPGMVWSGAIAAQRAVWLLLALIVTAVASFTFDRFNPAARVANSKKAARAGPDRSGAAVALAIYGHEGAHDSGWKSAAALSPLLGRAQRSRFATLTLAELKLCFKGVSRWWYLVALGLVIGGLAAPVEVGRRWLLPIAWMWPLLIWSQMGIRESRYGTAPIMFSAPRPVARQLPAIWAGGMLVAALCGAGVAVRLLLAGELESFGAWCAAVAFIPSLALACGVCTGGSKMFEVIYLLLWYIGPMSAFPVLDYMGSTPESVALGVPLYVAAIAVGLGALAYAGRLRQLRSDRL